MENMQLKLQRGVLVAMTSHGSFTVGDWLVEPDLDRITRDSGSTSLRPQVMELLVFLARQDGQVARTEDLLDNLWAGKFVTDGTLYNCVGELRQALADGEAGQKYIETIPKKGYRLVVPVTGLDEPPGRGESKADGAGSKVSFAIASFVVALLAIAGTWVVSEKNGSPTAAGNSIAVLPFVDLSESKDQEYFGDGVAEEILNMLAQVKGLRVTARTSSFQFKAQNLDVRAIGESLNVAAVLEGSVRKSGDTLRITAQLVSTEDGFHLWSETYDRLPEDIFAVQDDIAGSIVEGMRDHFGLAADPAVPASRITTASGAYDLYLQGLFYLNTLFQAGQEHINLDGPDAALDFFSRAIDADPDFAPAWAGRARALNWLAMMQKVSWEEAGPGIGEYIAKALQLGPNIAEVQFAAGWVNNTLEGSLEHYERAVEINPNYGEAHASRARILRGLGRYRESFDAAEIAIRLDPLSMWTADEALNVYFFQGKTERLEEFLAVSVRNQPRDGGVVTEAFIRSQLGQFDRFPDLQRRADVIPGFGVETGNWIAGAPRHFGDIYLTLGLTDIARHWMAGLYDDAILMSEGRYGEAVEFLKEEFETGKDKELYAYRWQADIASSLVEAYLYSDQYTELTAFFDGLSWSWEIPGLPRLDVTNPPWPEVAYTFALFRTGRTDQAQEWLAHLIDGLEDRLAQGIDVPNHYYELARLRSLQGRIPEAFAALELAIEKGWRRWYFDLDPILEPVRALPEFAALKARYDADISRMRDVVAADLAANPSDYGYRHLPVNR